MGPAGYTIHGGQTDADRLARQAGVMAAATMAFLIEAGAGPGMACLDVGCGDGQVSIALARLVGQPGRVVGIDADSGAIAIARRAAAAAAAAGVGVTFVEGDAATPAQRSGVDLAFARLLLSHLVDPMAVIRAMRLGAAGRSRRRRGHLHALAARRADGAGARPPCRDLQRHRARPRR